MIRCTAVAGLLLAVSYSALTRPVAGQTSLQITYSDAGIQTVAYGGRQLENVAQFPEDAFHIWHMKCSNLDGSVNTNGQCGWGEQNIKRSWDSQTKTWTYTFQWGSITTQYVQSGDTLNINVTETNNSNSGVVFDGASIYPLALHFPQLPTGFINSSYNQFAFNTTAPGLTLADFGTGEVVAATTDSSKALYSGFQPTGTSNAYTALVSSTSPDSLATFQPHNDRPVQPGQTDTFTVSLRFAPSGTPLNTLAADVYSNWATTWPVQLRWADRRAIGTVYLASSAAGDSTVASGYANNPRRYFNDANPGDFDITTKVGLTAFQNRVLRQAKDVVTNLRRQNAQGVITWDIEGEQYPMNTSYICSPDQIAAIAPEMESVVTDATSGYAGMKLDDAYFKTIRDGGFRVGVCVRPQHFTLNVNGTAQQVMLGASGDVVSELIRKMQYAHERWGATLFYIDSSVDGNGAALDASIFQQAAAALSDSLLIPEWSTPKAYAYAAPFKTFLFHGDLGTDASVYNYYPNAFSVNLINDVNPLTLATNQAALTASVKRGDVLMVHSEYWQANNPTVMQIYADASATGPEIGGTAPVPTPPPTPIPTPVPTPVPTPTPTPVPTPPVPSSPVSIVTPAASQTVSGTITVTGAISLTLDAAGSYLTLDGAVVGGRRVTGAPYIYNLDTTIVADGQHSLQLWAHDVGNNTVLSPAVIISVANSTSVIAPLPTPVPPVVAVSPTYPIALTYPVSGQAVTGVVYATASIGQTLDAAGSYLIVDGQPWGTRRTTGAPYVYELDTGVLSTGIHTLQVWAHDIGNNNLLSNTATISVTR